MSAPGRATPATRPTVVLVDAYTSAGYLAPEFRALGANVVHVRSTPSWMPSMPVPDMSGYAAELAHTTVAETVRRLEAFAPVAVLAGQEPGVELADVLAERMGLPGNGTALSAARRDKYLMTEALRSAGLHCADQFASGDVASLRAWAAARLGAGPVVVKPLKSAASDAVFVCRTTGDVERAARAVLGSVTIYGERNDRALVQTFLRGTEYVVDMVSLDGARYLCGVWRYVKRLLPSGRNIYDEDVLMPSGAPVVAELGAYVDAALTALGVRHGPTHAEVIVTPDGPALVEVGARLAGNMHPRFHDRCLGANQATLTALAVLDPARFAREYAGRRYTRQAPAICCTTSTTQDGIVTAVRNDVVARIRALPTVARLDLKLAPGDRIRPTVDLYSSTMRIFLCGPDEQALAADRACIEELKDQVFAVEPVPSGCPLVSASRHAGRPA